MHASLQTVEGKNIINPMSTSSFRVFCIWVKLSYIELPLACMPEQKLGNRKATATIQNFNTGNYILKRKCECFC